MPVRPKLVLFNHFDLAIVSGTTVMFAELLRVARRSAPEIEIHYASLNTYASETDLRAWLDKFCSDAQSVVAANAHIEVYWNLSKELYQWCQARDIPSYVFVHDYWPHHKDNLDTLKRSGAVILASTPSVAETLRNAGFVSRIVGVGIPLPDIWPPSGPPPSQKIVASAGRLVPRKRLPDIVRAFAESNLDGQATLYLRALPSQVFGINSDREQLAEIQKEIARGKIKHIRIDRQPGVPPDYQTYSAYVCASSYEGFSMTVIESAFYGCPPLMSDIPPHRSNAQILFGEKASEFLYPVGDCSRLAVLLCDEIMTGQRRTFMVTRLAEIRTTISSRWSLGETARALSCLIQQR